MIRSICTYQINNTRCSKAIRSRLPHAYCREHTRLVHGRNRPINRVKKVKITKQAKIEEVKASRKKR